MKVQLKHLLLGLGDILVLAFFFFFTGFTMLPGEPADVFPNMILVAIPFMISWVLINIIFGLFSAGLDFRKLFVKLFLACLINATIGVVCQYFLARLLVKYGEPTFDIEILVYIWCSEFVVMVVWRGIYSLLQAALQSKKYPMLKKAIIASMIVVAALGVLLLFPRIYIAIRYSGDVYTVNNSPEAPVAIVFGAGLNPDGSPSIVLAERVATAAKLYQAKKAGKLLMSGSKTSDADDEPNAMKQLAVELSVPQNDILLDDGGDRAYNTCQRAKTLYQFTHAILVAQNFYLHRTLLICNQLGVASVGVSADDMIYTPQTYFFLTMREIFATDLAFWELYFQPK